MRWSLVGVGGSSGHQAGGFRPGARWASPGCSGCSAPTGARTRAPGRVGGHRRSRIYGRLDCPSALSAIARGGYVTHRVFFADEAAARAAGYRPCAVCLRAAYDRWAAGQALPTAVPGSASATQVRPGVSRMGLPAPST